MTSKYFMVLADWLKKNYYKLNPLNTDEDPREHQRKNALILQESFDKDLNNKELKLCQKYLLSFFEINNKDLLPLKDPENIGYFLLSEVFYDNLFYLPNEKNDFERSIFIHIPKTAGTSFCSELFSKFISEKIPIKIFYPASGFNMIESKNNEPYRLFRGIVDFINLYSTDNWDFISNMSIKTKVLIRAGHINLETELSLLNKNNPSYIPNILIFYRSPYAIIESFIKMNISYILNNQNELLAPGNRLEKNEIEDLRKIYMDFIVNEFENSDNDIEYLVRKFLDNKDFKYFVYEPISSYISKNLNNSLSYLKYLLKNNYPIKVSGMGINDGDSEFITYGLIKSINNLRMDNVSSIPSDFIRKSLKNKTLQELLNEYGYIKYSEKMYEYLLELNESNFKV